MTYWVTYKIDARYTIPVEAESVDEALMVANDEYFDANFGEAHDIEGYAINMSDEQDNIVWEK